MGESWTRGPNLRIKGHAIRKGMRRNFFSRGGGSVEIIAGNDCGDRLWVFLR